MRSQTLTLSFVVLLALACRGPERETTQLAEAGTPEPEEYLAEIVKWRSDRDARLRRGDGWLSLVGLFWLDEGDNRFGSAPDNDLVFPAPAPPYWGTLRRAGREVWAELRPAGSDEAALEGPVPLALDSSSEPTMIEHATLSFYAIERGDRIGVRLKDSASPLLATFEGMESYPVDPSWRLEGRFLAYEEPKTVQVPNVIGGTFEDSAPGRIEFEFGGTAYGLEPTGDLSDPEASLFLVFGDETNGDETYGGGRFLYADPPDAAGRVVVDFNKAHNPPCVFTPYATCPLPRSENKLAVRIEAGETAFRGGVP